MQVLAEILAASMMQEIKHRLVEESADKIKACLQLLSEEEVWERPNDQVMSVGNQLLHLCGNVRQYIVSGAGGAEDTRTRQAEFDERGPIAKAILLERIDQTLSEVNATLDRLTPEQLTQVRPVQCYEMSAVAMIIHATEHFSYHVGQIVYYTKMIKGVDMKFYADQNLDATDANDD
ncbi:MAG: DinB family protein [Bacteroidota bacterium]